MGIRNFADSHKSKNHEKTFLITPITATIFLQ